MEIYVCGWKLILNVEGIERVPLFFFLMMSLINYSKVTFSNGQIYGFWIYVLH